MANAEVNYRELVDQAVDAVRKMGVNERVKVTSNAWLDQRRAELRDQEFDDFEQGVLACAISMIQCANSPELAAQAVVTAIRTGSSPTAYFASLVIGVLADGKAGKL